MNSYSVNGRPTQFHAVPPEERAFDENGKQLPWSLEWPEDHPNTRGQKRRPMETGPFGKSTRRKGSSRATRTVTPAKKESSAVDGFTRGLEEDRRRAELYGEGQHATNSNTSLPQDVMATTMSKEPVQVMLYGFSPPTQWAAISHYERASGGIICEDYERHPPAESRRIPTTFSSSGSGFRRTLTAAEKKLSMSYKGGTSWIRVTFDSAEAAERACYFSPHAIQGYWVYAELYTDGVVPNDDEPIPVQQEDRQAGTTTPAMPSHIPTHKTTQSLGPAFMRTVQSQQAQSSATLPRGFALNSSPQMNSSQRNDPEPGSGSPSTASSATATAPTPGGDDMTLRQRGSGGQDQSETQNTALQQQSPPSQENKQFMRFFPDVPRTVLRPASEAFLPQPTWTQKTLKYFEDLGLIPRDVIGHAVPFTESGQFDWNNASFYWRICYWVDTTIGTDICGLKDD
ncbi:MAG: hypothetical protein Q9209_001597 [Squamulea sp. 1 TL-2023]